MMTSLCSLQARLFARPRHHRSIRCQAALHDFVPSQQLSAVGIKELFDAHNEVGLQLVGIFQPLVFHSLLALGACFPLLLPSFVAPDVDIFGGEKLHHLGENTFEKGKHAIVSGAEVGAGIGLTLACEVWIGSKYLVAMAWHLYFGYHGDVPFGRVCHDVAHFVLRIISAISPRIVGVAVAPVVFAPPFSPVVLGSVGRFLNQFGVFLHLQTPSSTIG